LAGAGAAARFDLPRRGQAARAVRGFAHRDLGADARAMAPAPCAAMTVSIHVDTAAALRDVLAVAGPDLQRHCRDPWVVIGSAAVRLAGADVAVADLDVLTSVRDADTLIGQWRARRDETHAPAGAKRFRSRFARFLFPGLPVEVMGGLELCGE